MAEAASLSVSITGDASGLISAMQSAEASIAQVQSSAGKLMNDFNGKEAKLKLTAVDNTAAGVASARANINSLSDRTVTISVRYNVIGMPKLAGGTKYAAGGLSVINDERGKRDPRELVEHNGSLMMFDGRDVIVPLAKGDKVYTADETRRIIAGLNLPHYASGKNNEEFTAAKSDLNHYKKTHNMTASEELEAWTALMERFAYDADAVWEIEEQIFSASQKVFSEQEKIYSSQKKLNKDALADYKKSSDAWIKYQTQVNDMSVQGQINAYSRQLYNYNAMVSEMAASTLYTAEEMKEIWDDFYDYKAGIDLKIGLLQKEDIHSVYEKWQSDAKNWKTIRDTYDDWEESGDSHVQFYERSLERIKEMYEGGYISWQEYSDDTMEATLKLYEAKMEMTDDLLNSQKKYIESLRREFAEEENDLYESWQKADRDESKAEISRQLSVFEGAVTQRGMDKYKSLQEQMKKIRREEEMYQLQKSHSRTLSRLESKYELAEENKKYLLGVIERSGLNIEGIASGARKDIEGMQTTITSLFNETIRAIKAIKVSSKTYSDNRSISITSNNSSDYDALTNRVIGSIAHGNFY